MQVGACAFTFYVQDDELNLTLYFRTLRKMLKAGDLVDIKLWTKNGAIQCWCNCIPLRYNFYQGTQQFKLLDSHQIRQARICCIFEIYGLEVFL